MVVTIVVYIPYAAHLDLGVVGSQSVVRALVEKFFGGVRWEC